ncbi:hypothetical protein N7532_010259 [Penicillium argentinense]|uniref:Heterokaryon incompatibility domain-containing protein n=1 Tax=Penicillium argentinense TaxID=1131581 RepID=A0A9W9EP95_9EURO|nr:uncharacterized protein N7532_010259 [Penicillium argentinense]KAJ5085488.1 hypothetical protein N7532_010259 [Penicillium argentinense]
MRRWHQNNCQTPTITLISQIPHCSNCSATATFDEASCPATTVPPLPTKSEGSRLKWPGKARYLGEFSSDVKVTQPARKVSRVDTGSTPTNALPRPELLFDDEIRLVRLESSYVEGPVHVHFEKVHLHQAPVPGYDALSYAKVGDPLQWKAVFVDEFWDVIFVHQSCEEALRRLRELKVATLVWIDCLCVDLLDAVERNHQVELSRGIFENAKAVLAYLGPESAEIRIVFDAIKGAGASGVIDFQSEASRNAWQNVLDLPIFARVWVYGEVLTGKTMKLLANELVTWPNGLSVPQLPDLTRRAIFSLKDGSEPSDRELLDVLLTASQYESTDPRDKVFGILSLVNEGLKPDYSLPVEDIYTGIAAYLATYLCDMRILAFAGASRSTLDIPSWVPDWNQKKSLDLPRLDIDSSELSTNERTVPLAFHGMVSNNIEILVDPKLRALQCSAIKLCNYNKWQGIRPRPFRCRILPRNIQGRPVDNRLQVRDFDLQRGEVSAFLIQGIDHPVLLRHIPKKEAYELVTTCIAACYPSTPGETLIPGLPNESGQEAPSILNVYPLSEMEKESISNFDNKALRVIQRHTSTPLSPDLRTFAHASARYIDIATIFQSELGGIEKSLRDSWREQEERVGWLFNDHKKLWSFVSYLEDQDSDIRRGIGKMPRAEEVNL